MNIVLFIKTVQTRTIHGRDEPFRLQYFIVIIVDIKLKKRTFLLRHINMMKSFLFRFIDVVSHQRMVCVLVLYISNF